jgi:hypothetical protein
VSYSDLAYYAYGRGGAAEKVGTFVREHGLAGLRDALSAVSPAQAALNIAAKEAWLAANPLPADASEETREARALAVAALARAKSLTATAAQRAAAAADFAAAQSRYRVYAAAQSARETPSALALWLADRGLDLSGTVAKLALFGGVGVAVYLLVPVLLRQRGRS